MESRSAAVVPVFAGLLVGFGSACSPPEIGRFGQALESGRIDVQEQNDGTFRFTLLDLPAPVTSDACAELGLTAFHAYWWDFGDCSPPEFEDAAVHSYEAAGSYSASARAIALKQSGGPIRNRERCDGNSFVEATHLTALVKVERRGPPRVSPPARALRGLVGVGPALHALGDGTIVAKVAQGGKLVDYVVQLDRSVPAGSSVQVTLPADYLHASESLFPASCAFTYSLSLDEGAHQYHTLVGPVAGGATIHLPVLARPFLVEGTVIDVAVRLLDAHGDVLDSDESHERAGGCLDPNDKSFASCDGGARFQLQFENDGDALAQTAWVVDELPPGLDIATLRVESVEAPGVGQIENPPLATVEGIGGVLGVDYHALALGREFARGPVVAAVDRWSRRLLVVVRRAELQGLPATPHQRMARVTYSARAIGGSRSALAPTAAAVYLDNVNRSMLTPLAHASK